MERGKKGSSGSTIIIGIIFLILVAGGIGGFLGYSWYKNSTTKPNSDSAELVNITVKEGSTLLSLGDELEQNGLIESKLALKIYLKVNKISPNIKAGDYRIPQNLTLTQVIDTLEQGPSPKNYWVTVKEGITDEEVAETIYQAAFDTGMEFSFVKSEFLAIVESPTGQAFSTDVQEFISAQIPSGNPLTGFLYPDTYNIANDSTSLQIIEMMIKNLQTRLQENEIDLAKIDTYSPEFSSLYEGVTLASILEKETNNKNDYALVSGIFHNRLANFYPLQSDATVNFITGKKDFITPVEDTEIDSPYNTYKNVGLPPTPINNPGINVIKAALEPEQTDYFFFLYDKDGNIHLAETFEQHQINSANYL